MKKVISAVVAITVLLSMMITTNISTGITASAAAADSITIDAAKLASLSTAVGSAKVTTGASQGASNALIVSNPSGNFSPENYVKIDLSSYKNDMSHMRDIKIKMTSNAKDRGGDKAHFGVIYKSNVAWDIPYTGGLVPLGADGYVDVSVCRGFDSLKNSSWSSNGAYETRYYVTVSSLSSVSAILICPAYGGNTVSIESIKLVDVDDITTATLPAAGKIFCDWTGAVNHCKGEQAGTIKKGTPKNLKMPASYTASNGYMSIDTTGYTFNGNYVQIEVQMDKTKVQQAIDAANAGDGYLYGKIRFLGAKDGAGADIVKTTFKVYVFDSVAGWQAGMPELVAINEYTTTERSEVAYKCHVDNLEGMIPDTIAINYSNRYYEDGISFLQVQYSPIFSASADTSATFPVETPTMDKVTGTRPTTAAPTTQPTQATAATTTTSSGSSSTVDSKLLIDWDVNTNYWAEGSTLTKGTNCITATKSSGAKLITSEKNNIAAYDGLKFTVTPNSANQKTALVVKVDGVSKNFTLGSGTTECVLSFAEIGVTPTSSSTIFFGAEGDGAADLTISDVYAYTGNAGDSTTATVANTTITTTTTATEAATTTTVADDTTTTAADVTTTTAANVPGVDTPDTPDVPTTTVGGKYETDVVQDPNAPVATDDSINVFSMEDKTAKAGDTIEVPVVLSNVDKIWGAQLNIAFDTNGLEFVSFAKGDVFVDVLENKNDVADGFISVLLSHNLTDGTDVDNVHEGGVVFTLTFKVLDTAAEGTYGVAFVDYDAESFFEIENDTVDVAFKSAIITVAEEEETTTSGAEDPTDATEVETPDAPVDTPDDVESNGDVVATTGADTTDANGNSTAPQTGAAAAPVAAAALAVAAAVVVFKSRKK